ncbi:MAG: PKD domain-containing protein [Solirubrobacteraceae bacterium]
MAAAAVLAAAPAAAQAASPHLYANGSPTGQVGLQIWDHTNLLGGVAPTGTIGFTLFGPGDAACATPTFAGTVPVSGTGSDDSPRFWTSSAGADRWIATYSGDANNSPTGTTCGDPGETVLVEKRYVGSSLTAGQYPSGQIHGTFAISGGFSPTGIVTFSVTGPGDTYCAGPVLFTSTVPANDVGSYDSGPVRRPAQRGRYTFRIRYGGDTNNYGVGPSNCLDQPASVEADELPVAAYTPSTYSPVTGQPVSYRAAATDADGTMATYRWVWGDGTPDGSGPTPAHAFATPGLRSVGLYVTDSDGMAAAVGHGITAHAPDEALVVAYTPSTYTPTVGQAVTFSGSAGDPDGSIVTYRWVWGDGTPDGSGPTATHAFGTPGLRSVGFYVADSDGMTAAVAHGITAGVPDELPVVAYTPSTFTPTVGQTVTFSGSAGDPDGSILTYRWVWGDGTPDGSGPTPAHAFATPGLRSVGLYVTDSDGRTAAVGHGITVSAGAGPLASAGDGIPAGDGIAVPLGP